MEQLTKQKLGYIAQVSATMEIEDMKPDAETRESLMQIAAGKKTAAQVINRIKKEYING